MELLIQDNLASIAAFWPESVLVLGALALFLVDALVRRSAARRAVLTVTALATLAVAALLLAHHPAEPSVLFNGLLANDAFATYFKWLALAAGALTVAVAAQGRDFADARIGELYALLTCVVLGLFLMASAVHLLTLYLAIELVSMLSYVLVGLRRRDLAASEASLKYVLFGAVASGVMLFGMSWLYALLGTADLREFPRALAAAAAGGWAARLTLAVALVFVSSGIGYKIASVPWHMWCPDVYEGAPTPFTAFLSVGPKAAGFAVALRFFYGALAQPGDGGFSVAVGAIPWPALVGLLAAATMTLGNLTALPQTNLKRLLAYSSIAHAGFLLMGLSASSGVGTQGVLVYLAVYVVMNMGAFIAVIVVAEGTGSESILDYRGLVRRAPFTAICFGLLLVALTGLPPTAGFTAKWYLFYAVLERAVQPGGFWYAALAVVAALNTAVALGYYARVLRAMFLDPPPSEDRFSPRPGYQVMVGACAALVLLFGLWWTPLVDWSSRSLQLLR